MKSASLLLPLFVLAGTASAQAYVEIAFESFDYPAGTLLGDQNGGTGWLNVWWSGQNKDGGLVVAPSCDAVGNKLTQNIKSEGSYRKPDPAGHDDVTENGTLFGADDTTIWFSFDTVKHDGSDDLYGGLSLFQQFVGGEKLFMGSPYLTGQWGVEQTGIYPPVTDGNSDNTVKARLVFRLDFLPGQERVRMWVDPMDPHPDLPAPVDTFVDDFRFDEIRFESGGGMDPVGWDWDAFVMEKQKAAGPIGQNYCGPANLNSTGQSGLISAFGSLDVVENLLELTATQLPQNEFGYFLASMTQGFAMPPGSQGFLCLGGTIGRFTAQLGNTGAAGELQIDVDLTAIPIFPPVAVQPGETWNFQCWFRDKNPNATSNFTDAVQITFQ